MCKSVIILLEPPISLAILKFNGASYILASQRSPWRSGHIFKYHYVLFQSWIHSLGTMIHHKFAFILWGGFFQPFILKQGQSSCYFERCVFCRLQEQSFFTFLHFTCTFLHLYIFYIVPLLSHKTQIISIT